MKKLMLVLCTLVLLAAAPSAFGCAECFPDGPPPYCNFEEGPAIYCWLEFDEGCWQEGRCPPGRSASGDLAAELQIASVEIRQGDTLVAETNRAIEPAIVARKPVTSHVPR